MKKNVIIFCFVILGILLAGTMVNNLRGPVFRIDKYVSAGRSPGVYPDYNSTVIPPNIAPLNFTVLENGSYYFARIYCEKGEPIEVSSRSPKIMIPAGPWKAILDKNRGGELRFDIFVGTDKDGWVRFDTITSHIAAEDVDGYLVYRRMHPTHTLSKGHLGLYQRDLRNFDESIVFDNRGSSTQCVNCHTFCENRPDKVLMGVRDKKRQAETLLIEGRTASKIDTKFGYTSWHPSGNWRYIPSITCLCFFIPPETRSEIPST